MNKGRIMAIVAVILAALVIGAIFMDFFSVEGYFIDYHLTGAESVKNVTDSEDSGPWLMLGSFVCSALSLLFALVAIAAPGALAANIVFPLIAVALAFISVFKDGTENVTEILGSGFWLYIAASVVVIIVAIIGLALKGGKKAPAPVYGGPYGSQAYGGPYGGQPYGGNGGQNYGRPPYGGQNYGQPPYGAPPRPQQPYGAQPYGQQPYGAPPRPQQQYGAQQYGAQQYGQQQYGRPPYAQSPQPQQPYANQEPKYEPEERPAEPEMKYEEVVAPAAETVIDHPVAAAAEPEQAPEGSAFPDSTAEQEIYSPAVEGAADARFCTSCGGKLTSQNLYCPNCGAKVE